MSPHPGTRPLARLGTAVLLLTAPPTLAAQPALRSRPLVLRADFEPPAGGAGPALGAPPAGWALVWPLPPGASVGLDTTAPHAGRLSLRLVQPAAGRRVGAFARRPVTLSPDAVALRVRVWIRTDHVSGRAVHFLGAFAPAYAALRRPPAYVRSVDSTPALLAGVLTETTGPTGTTPWTRYDAVFPVLAGRVVELAFALRLDGTGTAWYDDLVVEPLTAADVAAAPPSAAARAYALAAFDTLRAHALDADQVDWPALRAHVLAGLAGARNRADAYEAVRFALRAVNPHARFQTPAAARADLADDPAADTAPGTRPTGAVLGRHGYLAVPEFHGLHPARMTRYAEAAHAALRVQAAAGVCGYLVDLRGNTGGNSYPMLAAVGPLLFAYYREADGSGWWRYDRGRLTMGDTIWVDVRRPAAARPRAPVAVLVDGRTASAAEAVLLRFVGRDGARTFGQPTAGYTTGNGDYGLADGARLVVTTSRMRDRLGRRYGGVIAPDEVVAPAAGDGPPPAPADDPVVRAAAAWLDTRPACRAHAGPARVRAG